MIETFKTSYGSYNISSASNVQMAIESRKIVLRFLLELRKFYKEKYKQSRTK